MGNSRAIGSYRNIFEKKNDFFSRVSFFLVRTSLHYVGQKDEFIVPLPLPLPLPLHIISKIEVITGAGM